MVVRKKWMNESGRREGILLSSKKFLWKKRKQRFLDGSGSFAINKRGKDKTSFPLVCLASSPIHECWEKDSVRTLYFSRTWTARVSREARVGDSKAKLVDERGRIEEEITETKEGGRSSCSRLSSIFHGNRIWPNVTPLLLLLVLEKV